MAFDPGLTGFLVKRICGEPRRRALPINRSATPGLRSAGCRIRINKVVGSIGSHQRCDSDHQQQQPHIENMGDTSG